MNTLIGRLIDLRDSSDTASEFVHLDTIVKDVEVLIAVKDAAEKIPQLESLRCAGHEFPQLVTALTNHKKRT